MTGAPPVVALRIDVDTLRGTRDGVPALLDELDRAGVRASFFFSVGPDNSGRAWRRAITTPGFAGKMWRTNAVRMYGWKAALYGTVLEAPLIGRACAGVLRQCRDAGHDVGLHAWDHVAWQDTLARLDRPAIDAELDRGTLEFANILGEPPRAFAAPGWICTDEALQALDARGFDYLSVSRGAVPPYLPRTDAGTLRTPEIPTTLPTFDEELGRDGVTPANYVDRLVRQYRPGATEVLTVHAETEGLAYRPLFRALLDRHRRDGIVTRSLRDVAIALPPPAGDGLGAPLAVRRMAAGTVPGRAGLVACVGESALIS